MLIIRILKDKGFRCDIAASVLEAQGLLETKSYAILITDMKMWGEAGLDLVRFATEEYPTMAAIMVSGSEEVDLDKKVLQAGASFFIRKPFEAQDLVEKVNTALDAREEAIKLRKHQQW